MNAVIYARYSSHNQREESIEGQIRVCTEYAESKGYTVINNYIDRAMSGKTDNRPAFQQMIADSSKKLFNVIIVYKIDRFSRDKYDSAIYKRQLKQNGVSVAYAAENIPDTPEGIILESLMEGFAEYYSAELAQKVKRGMQENALKGKANGSPRTLGYITNENRTFNILESEANTVKKIFELYLEGQKQSEIINYLNIHGMKTAKGVQFKKNDINRIITNEKYIGVYKHSGVRIEGGMPAIIEKDTFNDAQIEFNRRKYIKMPKNENNYSLSGKIHCGICESTMSGTSGTSKNGKTHYYYICSKAKNNLCDKENVNAEWLENIVVNSTLDFILNPNIIDDLIEKVYKYQLEHSHTSDISDFEKRIKDNKKSQDNIISSIEKGKCTDALLDRLEEIGEENKAISSELEELKQKNKIITREEMKFYFCRYEKIKDAPDTKKEIIKNFVEGVYLTNKDLIIHFKMYKNTTKINIKEVFAQFPDGDR